MVINLTKERDGVTPGFNLSLQPRRHGPNHCIAARLVPQQLQSITVLVTACISAAGAV